MVKEIGRRVNRLRALALGMMVGTSPFSLASGAHAQAQVGTSAAVQGDVFVRIQRQEERRAQIQEAISLGDQVLTKQESALQILLLDASIFTVGENADLVIDRFVYDPDTGAGEMAASVATGAFRFMSGRIGRNNPTNVDITVPSATIGIRGTFVDCVSGEDAARLARYLPNQCDARVVDPSKASLCVLRGPGRGRNTLDRTGRMTVSNAAGTKTASEANYAIFVPGPGEEPCGPFPMPPEVQQYLDLYLRSTPDGPSENPLGIDDPAQTAGQTDRNEPEDDLGIETDPTVVDDVTAPEPDIVVNDCSDGYDY